MWDQSWTAVVLDYPHHLLKTGPCCWVVSFSAFLSPFSKFLDKLMDSIMAFSGIHAVILCSNLSLSPACPSLPLAPLSGSFSLLSPPSCSLPHRSLYVLPPKYFPTVFRSPSFFFYVLHTCMWMDTQTHTQSFKSRFYMCENMWPLVCTHCLT